MLTDFVTTAQAEALLVPLQVRPDTQQIQPSTEIQWPLATPFAASSSQNLQQPEMLLEPVNAMEPGFDGFELLANLANEDPVLWGGEFDL